MKQLDVLKDVIFPTITIRELGKDEKRPDTHNWVDIQGKTFVFEFPGADQIVQKHIDQALLPLRKVVEYQTNNRQVGHTTAMILGANPIQTPDILIVVGNMTQRHFIIKLLANQGFTQPDRNVITLDQLEAGLYDMVEDRPMVLDNVTLFEIYARAGGNIRTLPERKGKNIMEKLYGGK